MPNPIKYTTGSETLALKKGNFYIGTGSIGKGPSDVTGYYQGPSPVSGGYVIYMNKDGAPGNLSYHSAANDAQLISFTNSLVGQSYTGVQQCFDYYYGQTDKVLVNQDYPADYPYIVMDGLVLNLDAGITQSYPGSGTVWTDVNGLGPKSNGTLINGPTFSGGSIVFDGTNDYTQISPTGFNLGVNFTVQTWVNMIRFGGFNGGWNRGSIITNSYPYSNNQGFWVSVSSQGTAAEGRVYIPGRERFFISIGNDQFGATSFTGSLTNYVQKWVNLGVRVNGTNPIKLYINGVETQYDNHQTNGPSSLLYSSGPCSLGVRANNNQEFAEGAISSLLMYNRALSDSEVLQNFNATKGRFGL
jgi:hypothetical protein